MYLKYWYVISVAAYGLTELSPASHCSPDDNIKYGSIGVPIHNTKFKVLII